MHVIALHRELADAELPALARGREALAERGDEAAAAKRWHTGANAQRDVHREAARDGGPADVMNGRPRRSGLSPGARC
jgi:hypothetical protein